MAAHDLQAENRELRLKLQQSQARVAELEAAAKTGGKIVHPASAEKEARQKTIDALKTHG